MPMRTRLCVLAAFVLGVAFAFGQTLAVGRTEDGKYAVYQVGQGKASILIPGLPREPSVESIKGSVYAVNESLGSPNSYTYFVDASSGLVEGPFALFQAINKEVLGIVFAGKADKLMLKILFSGTDAVPVDLPRVAPVVVVTNAVTKIEFLADSFVRITYYSGPEFVERQVVVPWPRRE
jgi:hypothetical protein